MSFTKLALLLPITSRRAADLQARERLQRLAGSLAAGEDVLVVLGIDDDDDALLLEQPRLCSVFRQQGLQVSEWAGGHGRPAEGRRPVHWREQAALDT